MDTKKQRRVRKVYVSGRIGKQAPCQEILERFAKVEKRLRAEGYKVFNPTTSGLGKKAELLAESLSEKNHKVEWYDAILLLDLSELAKCDAICLIPGWTESPGARTEMMYAGATGKAILFCDEDGALL